MLEIKYSAAVIIGNLGTKTEEDCKVLNFKASCVFHSAEIKPTFVLIKDGLVSFHYRDFFDTTSVYFVFFVTHKSLAVWLCILIIICASLLPDYIYKTCQLYFFPSESQVKQVWTKRQLKNEKLSLMNLCYSLILSTEARPMRLWWCFSTWCWV